MKRKKDLYDYNLLHNFDFYKDLNAYILTNWANNNGWREKKWNINKTNLTVCHMNNISTLKGEEKN